VIPTERDLTERYEVARETIETLKSQGRTVVLTTDFARTTQDAILAALGWQDLGSVVELPALLTQLEPQTRSTMSAMESTTFVGR